MHDSQQDPGPTTDEPAATIDADVIVPTAPLRIVPGDRIGPFKVLELLGEGGFGAVYLCDQKEPVKRRVAVKIIKAGMDTAEVVSRFEAERQAMAMMSHPAIAKVFEAGATPEGRPYFVMEYVKGVPITEYCDAHRLGMNARLELFERVCHAVQHAHHKGIIHRDIKPGNVLVSIDGSREPLPKIIDFGIAKATSQQLTEETIHTQAGQMMGTLLYMSPEQAGLSTEDIDTRSDVYSLGVVLYQLISGRLPFEAELLREKGYFEMQRVIREEDPPRPSTHITTAARAADEETTRIAKERQITIGELANTLRRELEWIPLKALRKDRSERYSSAEALADDVHRYLAGEALEAGPESTVYRIRKLMRRHRGPVTAAALVGLTLIAGIFGTTKFALDAKEQARRAQEQGELADAQRAEADSQRVIAEQKTQEAESAAIALEEQRNAAQEAASRAAATTEFMTKIFTGIAPDTARSMDTSLLKQILENAKIRADAEFEGLPLVEVEIRKSLGAAYEAIFDFKTSFAQTEHACVLYGEALGRDDPDTLATQLDLGRLHAKMGEFKDAAELWGDAADRLRETQGPEFVLTRLATEYYAGALLNLGRVEEGHEILRREIEDLQRMLGPSSPEVLQCKYSLASGLARTGQHAEAVPLFQECLENLISTKGPTDPGTLTMREDLIGCLRGMGSPEEALAEYRVLLVDYESLFPADHPEVAMCRFHIGSVLSDLERHQEAFDEISTALAIHQSLYGKHHPGTLACGRIKVASLLDLGEFEAAAKLGEPLLEDHLQAPGYGQDASATNAVAGRLGASFAKWNEQDPSSERAAKAQKYTAMHEAWKRKYAPEEGD